MLADSPDALCSLRDSDSDEALLVAAVEVKTMSSLRTIEEAKVLAAQFGDLSILTDIGTDNNSLELFKKLFPSSGYR